MSNQPVIKRPSLDTSAGEESSAPVTHICSAVPPSVDGVGDYATLLAEGLRGLGVPGRLVALAPGGVESRGFAVARLRRRNAADLVGALEETGAGPVVLHFAGYGYARRGLCFWLADGLCRWRRRGEGRRLITVFHELYATGPVWSMAFWTSFFQCVIARRVAQASDAMLTTSPISAERLRVWRPDCPAIVAPVFSNVGELDAPAPLAERTPTAVVFGQAGRRRRAYALMQASADSVGAALGGLCVERILDIGPACDAPAWIAGVPVEALGPLPTDRVSQCLSNARAGFVDYPFHVLTKSGIVAAYLAHGVLCLNLSRVGTLPEGLADGREFAHPGALAHTSNRSDPQGIATTGHEWYQTHDRATTARIIQELVS